MTGSASQSVCTLLESEKHDGASAFITSQPDVHEAATFSALLQVHDQVQRKFIVIPSGGTVATVAGGPTMDVETIVREFSKGKMGLKAASRLSAMSPSKFRSLLMDRGFVFLSYDEEDLQRELEAAYRRRTAPCRDLSVSV
jgi:hypothetical protein